MRSQKNFDAEPNYKLAVRYGNGDGNGIGIGMTMLRLMWHSTFTCEYSNQNENYNKWKCLELTSMANEAKKSI